jgi:hypothetical protein
LFFWPDIGFFGPTCSNRSVHLGRTHRLSCCFPMLGVSAVHV